ncbi:MAG TPA: cytochrome P450 [Actinocrinis sp.]|uniref:cytochrome P450 family protein n=1 Tax=Actinocrinis sp. TaxID=1920516 RepID=UPI002DDDB4D1|nr:cytochrome P450 [Actinocrinis sp.]HEV2346649.1 cytochrome P450 [Actinocrinis sp.]
MSESQSVVELTGSPEDVRTVLQEAKPIQRAKLPNGAPVWLVTKHAEVREVLSDPRLLVKDKVDWFDQGLLSPHVRNAMNTSMLRVDPPDHTRMRKLVNKVFVPRRIEAMRPRIQQLAAELLDRLDGDGGRADLVADYAGLLPVQVICELLGIPAQDQTNYREWADAFTAGIGAPVFPVREVTEFVEHLRELVERRRAEPDDALLSALIAARDQTGEISEDELISTAYLFIVAGYETATNLIDSGLHLLLSDPARADRVRADPRELGPAIEEFLRFESPATSAAPRIASCPMKLFGAEVAEGEMIMVSLRAANHDPEVFDAPNEFRMDRESNPHLAFGHGIHFCIGAPLARIESEIAIGQFLNRFPKARLSVAPEDAPWRAGILTWGLSSLQVELHG